MPFTFSHVAAVLPMLRGRKVRWSSTGLILGSITPDFEKFLRLSAHNAHSHTWASLAYFSCPMALLLAFVFHGLVRNPLIAHLPQPFHRRLARYAVFNWGRHFRQNYVRVLLSVLLGGLTHLLWDALTHRQSPLVAYFPGLLATWHVGPVYAPAFVFTNALSSIMGMGLVLMAVHRLPVIPMPKPSLGISAIYWGLVSSVAVGLLAGRLLLAEEPLKDIDVIISVVSALMGGVGLASSFFRTVGGNSRRLA